MAEPKIRDLDTDIRVSVLETQVSGLTHNIEKIEKKIDDNYSVLHTRINELDQAFEIKNEKILQKIDDHSATSAKHNLDVLEKISKIEKWRWMIMGGALVVGYVLAHIKMENLF
jgi:predicted  nucleic acid-binding Zn-ribbon protein